MKKKHIVALIIIVLLLIMILDLYINRDILQFDESSNNVQKEITGERLKGYGYGNRPQMTGLVTTAELFAYGC